VIGGDGTIRHVFHKPKVKEHAGEVLDCLKAGA